MIKLLLSDLDGTLINEQMEMSDEDIVAIQHLRECSNIQFGIVTGRDVGIYRLYVYPKLQFDMDYIGNNGGSILSGDEKIYEMHMNQKDIYNVMKFIGDNYLEDTFPFVADDHCNFYFHSKKPSTDYWKKNHDFMAQVGTISDVDILDYLKSPDNPVVKASFYTKDRDASKITKILRERFGDTFEVTITSEHFSEMTIKGIHKGTAITKLLEFHNLENHEVAVIGDGENDIPMFRMFPKHAFVMHTASPEIQTYGQVVNSVAEAIMILLEQEKI